jgi:hypothetical protein
LSLEFVDLTDGDLEKMGIGALGDRKKVLRAREDVGALYAGLSGQ